MRMTQARGIVAVLGVTLPYLVRLPGGLEWLGQYTRLGPGAWLWLTALHAVSWGSILLVSLAYQRPASLLAPCLSGFGFLAWAHASLDLHSDAQAAIALFLIPLVSLLPIAIGALIGYAVDRLLRRSTAPPPGSRRG